MAYIGRQLVRGQNRIYDDISSSFNGSTTAFNLNIGGSATPPAQVNQLWIVLGGILQKPGTDFTVADAQVTFTTAPAAGLDFWAMIQGDTSDMNAPSDGSVTPTKIATSGDFAFPADVRFKDADGSHYVGLQAPTTVSSNLVWTLPAADGSANQILKTNGSGVLGWATDSATDSTKMPLAGGTFTGDVTFTGDSSNGLWDKSANAFVANVTGDLTGTASVASTVTLVDESSDTSCYVVYAGSATGNRALETGSNLTFNSSTGKLYVTEIAVNSNGSLFKENQLLFSPSGSAYIDHNTVDQDIIFRTSDASALDTTALTIDASDAGTAIFNHDVKVPDGGKFIAGADGDLIMYHSGGINYIESPTDKTILIRPKTGEEGVKIVADSAVELYHNNVKTFSTIATGFEVVKSGHATIQLGSTDAGGATIYFDGDSDGDFGGGDYSYIKHETDGHMYYVADAPSTHRHHIFKNQGGGSIEEIARFTNYGLAFKGDTAEANSLNDYEEGTWTPTISSGTFTAYQTQWYVKIGQLVTCYFYVYSFSDTSSSTHFQIAGLPFAFETAHETYFSCSANGTPDLGSTCMGVIGRIGQSGTNSIAFYRNFPEAATANLEYSHLNSGHFAATFSYVTAS